MTPTDPTDVCCHFRAATGYTECYACCYAEGAAAAFGLMGMAEAIRDRYDLCECWRSCECYHPEVIERRASRDRSKADG